MAQKITRWLLFTLILSLGFGQLLRFQTLGLTWYLHDSLVLAILLLQGRSLLQLAPFRVPGFKLILLGLLLGWLRALTLYPLSSLLIPSLYTLRLLAYLALYLVVQRSKIYPQKTAFLLAGLTGIVIGLTQYLFLPDMRWAQYLGWDDHLNRLTLPHFDPTFAAVSFSLLLGLLTVSQWPLFVLALTAILLTYSRSVFLVLSLTFAYLMLKRRQYLSLLIGLGLLSTAVSLLPQKFGEGTNLLRTYSLSSRLKADWTYLQTYRFDLPIGRGYNTLLLDLPSSKYENHATGPNNSYLQILLTSGVLGFWGWLVFLRHLYRRAAYPIGVLILLLASLFNNVLFYPFALLWILLAETMAPTSA